MAEVLVTGAPGWLGTALVEALVRQGRSVRCLVQPGVDENQLAHQPVEIVHGDVRDRTAVERAVAGVATVFHCAGLIHPRAIRELFEVNVGGTRNVLAAARKHGCRRFIYVSSNSAQGTTSKQVLMDEAQPCRPENAYGRSKLLAEQSVNRYQAEFGLPAVIVRPSMLYGPGQPERMTLLMRMVKTGRPLVFGDGLNLRSMSYVGNVVDGLLLAETSPVAVGQTYWIADERPYTTVEILETIASALGVRARPLKLPEVLARICEQIDLGLSNLGLYSMNFHVVGESPKNIACSIAKAKNELGYQPRVSLPEGIRLAVEWCRSRGYL